MTEDSDLLAPDKQIDRVRAEMRQRDGSYIMPMNHCHPYFELYYLDSGKCRFFIGEKILDVHGGDVMLIPPGTLHFVRYLFGPCRRFDLFFRRRDLSPEVKSLFPGEEKFFRTWQLMQVPDFYREGIASLFARLLGEEKIADRQTAPLMRCRLTETLLLLSRGAAFGGGVPADIHTTDRAIVRAAGYMREHLAEEITSADIASAAGFSPNYLSRKFRQATGMGVREYLCFVRLEKAAVELIETRSSVTDIALQCGFSDGNYFKDCFKKRYGISPRAFRSRRE